MSAFAEQYSPVFSLNNHNVYPKFLIYLKGLFQASKRNMERMVEAVPESDWQALQHFLSHSPWQSSTLMRDVAIGVNRKIGGSRDTGLLIDESAISKKGKKSVGVSRQHNGRLGKTDNCQVAVFAALNRHKRTALVGTRLFLPECWSKDTKRCDEAGIPKEEQRFRTKPELALELVKQAREQGLAFSWVGGDALYGNSPKLPRALDAMNEIFMLDVHKTQHLYLEDPQPCLPEKKSCKGRSSARYHSDAKSVQAIDWLEKQPKDAWKKVLVRDTTKGLLYAKVLHAKVWLWDKQEAKAHHWHLLVRLENAGEGRYKFSLSNAPLNTQAQRLAFMQAQRCFVERTFQDAKDDVGLAQYQIRTWVGWHHHVAIVMVALLFLLWYKIRMQAAYRLLSCRDIRDWLLFLLPSRKSSKQEMLRQMLARHRARERTLNTIT